MLAAMSSDHATSGAVEAAITKKMNEAFSPVHMQVINESGNHNVAPGSETHFKLVVVSESFSGQPPLDRHRAVNTILADELAGCVQPHAQSLHHMPPSRAMTAHAHLPLQACPRSIHRGQNTRSVGAKRRRYRTLTSVSWRQQEVTLYSLLTDVLWCPALAKLSACSHAAQRCKYVRLYVCSHRHML